MANTAITTRGVDVVSEETVAPSRGRPRSPKAQSPAQRSKSYRDRLDERGLKPVKCYLAPDQVAYLDALCKIHDFTISEAIGMALTALFRGGPSLPQSFPEGRPYPHIDGIYNTAGGNQGVAKALAEYERTGKTLFVTHEYNRVTEALIRQNEVDYLITQNMKHMMLEAVDHLNAILDSRPYSQQVTIPLEIYCHYSLPPANLYEM